MKRILQLYLPSILIALIPLDFLGQEFYQYFDGQDTIPGSSIIIEIDTIYDNTWEVGPPHKILFNQPSTSPML